MDDLTVTTTTHIQAITRVLSALEDSFSLARMKFKAKKSRCLVLWKGRVDKASQDADPRRGDPINSRKPD